MLFGLSLYIFIPAWLLNARIVVYNLLMVFSVSVAFDDDLCLIKSWKITGALSNSFLNFEKLIFFTFVLTFSWNLCISFSKPETIFCQMALFPELNINFYLNIKYYRKILEVQRILNYPMFCLIGVLDELIIMPN